MRISREEMIVLNLCFRVRLKNEVGIMLEQIKKHNAAKETLKAMNQAYKKQVDLVKEECELRLKVCYFSKL